MAAPTQYYVDPSIAGDSGAGTVGDPYGDLEYCLEQITRDATNGDQINIKAGTAELLEFALDIEGDYGAPTVTAPLIFRGYTTAANDGGIGDISGQGSVSIFTHSTADFIMFVDLHLHHCGSNAILDLDNGCFVVNCELDNTSGIAIDADSTCTVINCYIHDCTGTFAIVIGSDGKVYGCIISSSVTTAGIKVQTGMCTHNIIRLTATNSANGIMLGSDRCFVANNSVFAVAGTGTGITNSGTGRDANIITNNIVEGFSGTGGKGYDASSTDHIGLWGHNAAYNNTTNDNIAAAGGEIMIDLGGDDIPLDASAFTAPTSNDFSVGTEVKEAAMPNFVGGGTTPGTTQYLDTGAAQRQEPAGGGGGASLNLLRGLVG